METARPDDNPRNLGTIARLPGEPKVMPEVPTALRVLNVAVKVVCVVAVLTLAYLKVTQPPGMTLLKVTAACTSAVLAGMLAVQLLVNRADTAARLAARASTDT